MVKPRFKLSKSKVLEQYKKVKEISDLISYSSKTNPLVTPTLETETDCLFTIHTANELKHIKDKKRILFLAQGWDKKLIKELIGKWIFRFVVDNEADLDILLDYLKNHDDKIELMLRVKLKENSIKTERYFVFGMKKEIVNQKIKELKDNPKISSLGIHFHRKTQNMAEWNILSEIKEMFDKEIFEIIGVLNIGGGLPSIYANTNVLVFDSIYKKIKELKQWLNEKKISLMLEPGRFICAPAVELISNIISIYENNIIIDASVYNSDTDALTVPTKLLVKGELNKEEGRPYLIKGCTPCSMDIFRYKVYLKSPKVGDEIVFLNAGAYNFTTDFCDLEKIETEIIK